MFITRTVTKKILETIIQDTFLYFGNVISSSLLDSLKFLGFQYATNAGISINIEDLKTPSEKAKFLEDTNIDIKNISDQWYQGFISDNERFQSIIDTWNRTTESLKNQIIEYYQTFDPANNLYIMAFSGARGNMSQVRQLVGMRGLMSDQEGKIIDLPIQTNFREGLSSIDYIISSYGARKGIVDTALKTADSGYLTRRLIYVAQDLIIREFDCKTNKGVSVLLKKNLNIKNLIGRTLINIRYFKNRKEKYSLQNISLTEEILIDLKKYSPLKLNVRTPITCKANGSICQQCYGWDLAQANLISLGEAVGIIAAQSIGEPGTQLTMRTFHTGGIFTGESLKQILAPFSGKVIIPQNNLFKPVTERTNHGILVYKITQETRLSLVDWKGQTEEIFLPIGSYLYIKESTFLRKNQVIAEYAIQSIFLGSRRLKPIYSPFQGEIKFENIVYRTTFRDIGVLKTSREEGNLWIGSGKIFPLPKEISYKFPESLYLNKPFAFLKLILPFRALIRFDKEKLILIKKGKKLQIDFSKLFNNIPNCTVQISPLIRSNQFVEEHTIIAHLEFYSKFAGKIYSIKKKDSKYIQNLFFITESDVWTINSDQVNNYSIFPEKKLMIRAGTRLNSTTIINRSGFFLKRDGFKLIFQDALPFFLLKGTILNCKQGDLLYEKSVLATLTNQTQQTEDIVQGLPKIEELIEARRPKTKCYLAQRPGIFLTKSFGMDKKIEFESQRLAEKEKIKCVYSFNHNINVQNSKKQVDKKQYVYVAQSLFIKQSKFVSFQGKTYQALIIPKMFGLDFSNDDNDEYMFTERSRADLEFSKLEKEKQRLVFYGKVGFSKWKKYKNKRFLKPMEDKLIVEFSSNNKIFIHLKNDPKDFHFQNARGDLLLQTKTGSFAFLEYLNPLMEYELPIGTKVLYEAGTFIDLGEPFTEGLIDIHELLNILYKYHSYVDGNSKGYRRAISKFQLILVNSIQAIYQSQGVNISSKHIEIIVRQMMTKVVIKDGGDTPLLPGELIRTSVLLQICSTLKNDCKQPTYKSPIYEPILLSATNSSLSKDGFLSAAGFQETKRVLTKAAIEGKSDWLRGLKECIIVGRLIPAGSAFLNYKNYLDNIYLFKI